MLAAERARETPTWVGIARSPDSRGTSLAERLRRMAEPGVPGAWGPVTLFQQASCQGGAGARARAARRPEPLCARLSPPPRRPRPCRPAVLPSRRAPPAPGARHLRSAPGRPARQPSAASAEVARRRFLPRLPSLQTSSLVCRPWLQYLSPQSPSRTRSIRGVRVSFNHPLVYREVPRSPGC